MNPAEWFSFVDKNENYLVEHIRSHLLGTELSSILPGLPNTIYLRQMHGMIELTFDAVQLELDEEEKVISVDHLVPSATRYDSKRIGTGE